VPLQIVSSSAEPPIGDGWLHEVKHDGHRLLAIVAGDELKLISRNGHDRTAMFHEPFQGLAGPPRLVPPKIVFTVRRSTRRSTRTIFQCAPANSVAD
jgi:ATP-dependent DNA ligase